MRITLCIKGWFCDINGINVWYLMNNWGYVVDYDFSIFISLKKQKLSGFFVIVCVDSCYRDFLINLVVFQYGDQCLVLGVWFIWRWRPDDPDAQRTNSV